VVKLLIHYGKTKELKYLSHLEMLRAFERAFRRAGLDIMRSGGFNPRPKISYGSALSVGVASVAEYMMLDLSTTYELDELLKKISSVMPDGLSLYRAKYIQPKIPSIMSVVKCQKYFIKTSNNPDFNSIIKAINDIITEERLLVKHKEKEKWVETSKAILDFSIRDNARLSDEDSVEFEILLSVGDSDVIRPDVLMEMFFDRLSGKDKPEIIEICRTNQFVNRDIPLEDIYEFYESVEMGSERN
jgi:radical SAM-linked protein